MIAAALAFTAGALGALGLLTLAPAVPARRELARRERGPRVLRGLAAVGRRLAHRRAPRDLAGRIAAAGDPGGLGAREVMAAKVTAAALGGVAGSLLSVAAPGRLGSPS